MIRKNRTKKAYTLLEALIAMVVMSVIMMVTFNLMMSAVQINYKINARNAVITDLDFVASIIKKNLSSSDSSLKSICQQRTINVDGVPTSMNYLSMRHVGTTLEINYRLQDGVIITDTDFTSTKDDVNVSSTDVYVTNFEMSCTQLGNGTEMIIVTLTAKPTRGPYKDAIVIVRQLTTNTESFGIGF